MKSKLLLLGLMCAAITPLSATASIVVEDFESAPPFVFNGTVLSGMEFNTGGSLLSIVADVTGNNALNVLGFPNAGGGILCLDFQGGPVASVSADVSDATFPVVIEAYDVAGDLLGVSNTGGMSGIPTYETLSFSNGSADIAYVIIHDSGNDYYLDNITFSDVAIMTPEPTTIGIWAGLLCLAGIAGYNKNKN